MLGASSWLSTLCFLSLCGWVGVGRFGWCVFGVVCGALLGPEAVSASGLWLLLLLCGGGGGCCLGTA